MLAVNRFWKQCLTTVAVLLVLSMPAIASAATASSSSSAKASTTTSASSNTTTATGDNGVQAVTQGYATSTTLQRGMIVKLKDDDSKSVEPVTTATVDKILGVVTAANDTALSLSNNGNTGQVFVATSGRFDVLVSNQNGPIKSGDYITISALGGVGMKADSTETTVLGRATAAFTGTNNVVGSASLKDNTGKSVKVAIGMVAVDIGVGHNPLLQSSDKNLPGFLKQASQYVANKPVNASRVYLGLIVLIITSFISGAMLYSGIRGGLIAIGRNPLAKRAIVGGIFRVIISGIIVFTVGLFGVYLLLKL